MPDATHPFREVRGSGRGRLVAFPVEHQDEALSNNLPLQLSSFVGRERELAEVRRRLEATRLLTLTGSGGCGKTRLAVMAAGELIAEFEDGVWLVEFAPLADPTLVPQAVASALGVREQPGCSLAETLSDYLRAKKVLLVLDNCEHLIEACAALAEALLRSCPELRVLATSREALGIVGEVAWPVPPLSLPDLRRLPNVESLALYESARLFIERAAAVNPSFTLTVQNAAAVARVCYLLDGMPLAIELAAARAKVLPVEQISVRLEDSFKLLSSGGRTAMPHHRTLHATMDWSHELLPEEERTLFRRLAVFSGGFTLEAAESVCAGEELERDEVLELLSRLVDKSLVTAREEGGEARYRLLEMVRQYGRGRLEDSGEAEWLRERHTEHYLNLAEAAEPELRGARQAAWLERLEAEHDNIRAALSWALERKDGESALRLGGALGEFWHVHGHLSEGRRWLERGLAKSGASSPSARAKALNQAGWIAIFQGDGQAIMLLEESLSLYREAEDKAGVAASLANLGFAAAWAASAQSDKGRLKELREEAEALRHEPLDRWIVSDLLYFLALAAMAEGDFERAAELSEERLILVRGMGHVRGIIVGLTALGMTALRRGDQERTTALLGEGLQLSQELEDKVSILYCLLGLAGTAAGVGQPSRAARLWGAIETLQKDAGFAVTDLPPLLDWYGYENRVSGARSRLDEASWEAAWAEGQAMTLEEAVQAGLELAEMSETAAPQTYPAGLSFREVEVLSLVAAGLTNAEVAGMLFISSRTVNGHLRSIYHKIGSSSRVAAIRFATKHGLI